MASSIRSLICLGARRRLSSGRLSRRGLTGGQGTTRELRPCTDRDDILAELSGPHSCVIRSREGPTRAIPDHSPRPVGRPAPNARQLRPLRRQRGAAIHQTELATRMVTCSRGPAAARHPERCRRDRYPHARRTRGVRRHRARQGDRDCHVRAHRRGDRTRRLRARRQAGAELEGVGATAQPRAKAPAGEMVQAAGRRPPVPARALPDRAAWGLRPLAAIRRAGSRDADKGGAHRGRLGDQRPQAVHLQRLRRQPLRGLCELHARHRHEQGHVELPGSARHQGVDDRALQRDAGLSLHEQRRACVRGHGRAR